MGYEEDISKAIKLEALARRTPYPEEADAAMRTASRLRGRWEKTPPPVQKMEARAACNPPREERYLRMRIDGLSKAELKRNVECLRQAVDSHAGVSAEWEGLGEVSDSFLFFRKIVYSMHIRVTSCDASALAGVRREFMRLANLVDA